MSDISDLQARIVQFRDERDWQQFHNPKDLAISLVAEATELLDEFKWKTPEQANRTGVAEELMDVLYNVLLMCHDLNIDIPAEFEKKMQKNEAKYPVDLAKNSAQHHTQQSET